MYAYTLVQLPRIIHSQQLKCRPHLRSVTFKLLMTDTKSILHKRM
jgi:hypothetical protein